MTFCNAHIQTTDIMILVEMTEISILSESAHEITDVLCVTRKQMLFRQIWTVCDIIEISTEVLWEIQVQEKQKIYTKVSIYTSCNLIEV